MMISAVGLWRRAVANRFSRGTTASTATWWNPLVRLGSNNVPLAHPQLLPSFPVPYQSTYSLFDDMFSSSITTNKLEPGVK